MELQHIPKTETNALKHKHISRIQFCRVYMYVCSACFVMYATVWRAGTFIGGHTLGEYYTLPYTAVKIAVPCYTLSMAVKLCTF
jgi:hypothetical protein